MPEPTATPEPSERDCLSKVPRQYLLGQLIMTLAYPNDFQLVQQLSKDHEIGFMGILGSPSRQELGSLNESSHDAPIPLMIASDEEGGRVQRLRAELGILPSASVLSSIPLEDIEQMFFEYGKDLLDLGVSIVLAPVVLSLIHI